MAEHNNGDCLGLERPANVGDFLHEIHITCWKSDIGQLLWWYVRDLFKGVEERRTKIMLTKASYLVLTSSGISEPDGAWSVFFDSNSFISLSNVKLKMDPETSKNGIHTPKQHPKQAPTSGAPKF